MTWLGGWPGCGGKGKTPSWMLCAHFPETTLAVQRIVGRASAAGSPETHAASF
jgi:hypothetical protein